METDIVVDHYKEEKLEAGDPGQLPFCLGPGMGGGRVRGEAGPGAVDVGSSLLLCVRGPQPAQKQLSGAASI